MQSLLLFEKSQQEELLKRVSSLDQQLQAQSEALAKVAAAKDELRSELEKEMEEKKKLAQQVSLLSLYKLHKAFHYHFIVILNILYAILLKMFSLKYTTMHIIFSVYVGCVRVCS